MKNANLLCDYLSNERFARYYNACNRDTALAYLLYQANSRLANEFRTLLVDYVEVFIRNALNQRIAIHLHDPQWLLTKYEQLSGVTNQYLIKDIKRRFHDKELELSQDALVAELNFGFWASLFYKRPFATLKGQPIKIFTNRTRGFSRGQISNKLYSIRDFRNRITHGEPIVFEKGRARLSLYQASCIYKKIYTILDWLNPLLVPIVRQGEQVLAIMSQIELDFKKLLRKGG